LIKQSNDRDSGRVRKVEFGYDNKTVLACSEDGTMTVYLHDEGGIRASLRGDTPVR